MQVMLRCGGPEDPIDSLVWTGEVRWPAPPRSGDQVRVPRAPVGGDFLTVHSVLFESDGSVYVQLEPVDHAHLQRLRFNHDWRPWGESL